MKTLSALEFRKRFGEVLDGVAERRVPVAITRAGRRLVVLVPADEYDLRVGGREARLRLTVERLEKLKRRHARRLAGLDAAKLVRESRDER